MAFSRFLIDRAHGEPLLSYNNSHPTCHDPIKVMGGRGAVGLRSAVPVELGSDALMRVSGQVVLLVMVVL